MVVPVIFFQASAVEGKTAIPPPIAIFKLLWSSCLNSSLFTKALNKSNVGKILRKDLRKPA